VWLPALQRPFVAYPEMKFFDPGFSHEFLLNTVMGIPDL
jgi:hypothetical protein